MELIRGSHNLRARHRGCVATVGNYDGVHLGHRAVLERLADQARAHGLPAAVIVFEPTPLEFFAPQRAPARLTRFREKVEALAAIGHVDRLLCLRFDRSFAAIEPEAFIEKLLIERLAVRHLVVGDDFRFGRDRRGDLAMLQRAGAEHGFAVAPTPTRLIDGGRVSSSRVREALAAGDLALARRLLGRPYRMSGRVVPGEQLGRRLGFPTANIRTRRTGLPVHGVFAVRAHGLGAEALPGVASVGTRPTVAGREPLLEVHLFDFDEEIYGRRLDVDFVAWLRDEQSFPDLYSLCAQMERDAARAREALGLPPA